MSTDADGICREHVHPGTCMPVLRKHCLRCRIVPNTLDPPAHVEPEHMPEISKDDRNEFDYDCFLAGESLRPKISGNDLVWHQLACKENHAHRAPGCCPPDCPRCADVGMTQETVIQREVATRLWRARAEIEAEANDPTRARSGGLQLEVLLDIRDLLVDVVTVAGQPRLTISGPDTEDLPSLTNFDLGKRREC